MGFLVAIALVAGWTSRLDGDPPGANDFITFWSAYQVAADGGDAYAPEQIRPAQLQVGLDAHPDGPSLYFNPPWLLLLLAPILALPFDWSNATWLVTNVGLALCCAFLGWRLWGSRTRELPPAALAASLLFIPFLEALVIGQLGVLVAFLVLGTLLALRDDRPAIAGIGLGFWTIKAQLLLPLVVTILVHVIRCGRWMVVAAATATVVGGYAATYLLWPGTASAWRPLHGPTGFHTPTIAGWLRYALDPGGGPPAWPLVVVPVLGCIGAVVWATRRWPGPDDPAVVVVLASSLLVAPHAFVYDAVGLMVVQTVLLGHVLHGERRARLPLAVLALVQGGFVWLLTLPSTGHEDLIVVPPLLGLVWVWWRSIAGSEPTRSVGARSTAR